MPAFRLPRVGLRAAASRRAAVVVAAAGLVFTGVTTTAAAPAHASVTPRPAGAAIAFGLSQLGKPYEWGATGPNAYDCSGFTQASYRAAGISIPRVARDQYAALPKVAHRDWRPGDLIFYAFDTSRPSTIHHVAIYLGDGWMMDAPHTGTVVQVRPMYHTGLMAHAVRPGGTTRRGLLSIYTDTTGARVKALQKRLRANGYGVGVTGVFDSETKHAVSSVRAKYDLPSSSTVGWIFWHAVISHGAHTHAS